MNAKIIANKKFVPIIARMSCSDRKYCFEISEITEICAILDNGKPEIY
jgi:hypothetical protein